MTCTLASKFTVVSIALLWLSTGIAASSFWPVYASAAFVVMVVVTTLVGTSIAMVGARYRLPAHIVALMMVLAYVLFGVPLAVPSRALFGVLPTFEGLRDLAVATAFGWKQLVTISLPVGSFESLLVPAFLITLVTVTVSLSLALRSPRRELATLGPMVLFGGGVVFGASTAFHPVWQSLALLASLLLWLVWFAWCRRGIAIGETLDRTGAAVSAADSAAGLGFRTFLSAATIISLAGAAAAGIATIAAPGGERVVLRSTIAKPFDPRAFTSPLSEFRRYLQTDRAGTTMLTVEGLPPGGRLRIATLDSYDGVVYSVGSPGTGGTSGGFTLVPSVVDQSKIRGTPVSIDVTVDGYRGLWVPTIGALEKISFSGDRAALLRAVFYFSESSGAAVNLEQFSGGEEYRIDAVLPTQPEADDLAALVPGNASVPGPTVIPDELSMALERYLGRAVGAGPQLQAAIAGLREEGYVSHSVGENDRRSRSGHSANRITELFAGPQMIGDEEQYAVAAAIMARGLGFPARVVMGFVPDQTSEITTITGADVSAWIEVDTAQWGWVTIDPTPPERDIPAIAEESPAQVARPQSPVQPPAEQNDRVDEQQAPASASQDDSAGDRGPDLLRVVAQAGGVSLLAIAIAMFPFTAIIYAKHRRRRLRRRSPSSLDRVSGAWREFADTAIDRGISPAGSVTRSEFARAVGGSQPLILAAAADRAIFAPDDVTAAEVDRIWRSVDELRVRLDSALTRRQRWRARVSLRSLGVRSGRGTGTIR